VARQQRKKSTTLALRKTWQQRGCTGPQPHCSSTSAPDDDLSSTSTDDDSDLLDSVVDDDRCLTLTGSPEAATSALAAGASRHTSGKSASAVSLDCIVSTSVVVGHYRRIAQSIWATPRPASCHTRTECRPIASHCSRPPQPTAVAAAASHTDTY